MRLTAVLRRSEKSYKSLALSVYFSHPDVTEGRTEILSRASAFLWGIDPSSLEVSSGPYGHLEVAERRRKEREFRQSKSYTPAAGVGTLTDMGWLEFVPKEVRPQVHVVASSHVLSPFLWKDYYPQDWLSMIRQEHCTYALEVYDPTKPADAESLVKIALHPTPYHHPEGRDVGLIHLQEEATVLPLLKNLGVDILYARHPDRLYKKGESMTFDGYVVEEEGGGPVAVETPAEDDSDFSDDDDDDEDIRVFKSYREEGTLTFHTADRFFAATPKPLPEGLCGAPVLDDENTLCGMVEGIVPTNHSNVSLAGSAAFIPSFVLEAFRDFTERQMVQELMPPDLFAMVVNAKKTNSFGGGPLRLDDEGQAQESNWDEVHSTLVQNLKQKYTNQEIDAFLNIVRDEREEVLRVMDEEGGELDDIIARVRAKTLKVRDHIHEEFRQSQATKEAPAAKAE
jgi:hypothetical protein